MTTDEWLNACLLEGDKPLKHKDVLEICIYRTQFLRDVFNEIQRTVKVEIPAPGKGKTLQRYYVRVCEAVRKSGVTVVTRAK